MGAAHTCSWDLISLLERDPTQGCAPGLAQPLPSIQGCRGEQRDPARAIWGFSGGDVLHRPCLAGSCPPASPLEKPPALQQRLGPHGQEERPVPEDAAGGGCRERRAQPGPAGLGTGGGGGRWQPGLPDHLSPGQDGGQRRGAAGEGPPDLGHHLAHGG